MTSAATTPRLDDDGLQESVVIPEVSIASSVPTDNPRFQPPRASNGRFVTHETGSGRSAEVGEELPADRYLDREISWLQFNERVLQLAADESVPLLERAR